MRSIPTIEVGRPLGPVLYTFPLKPLALDRARDRYFRDTPKNIAYKDSIAQYAALQHPLAGPFVGDLKVLLTFYLQSRVHGDVDNLIKAIYDGVQARRKKVKGRYVTIPGVVMNDDKQIKAGGFAIVYDKAQPERTEMIVDRYNAEDYQNARILSDIADSGGDGRNTGALDGTSGGVDF